MDRDALAAQVREEIERAAREVGARTRPDWEIDLADRLVEPLERLLGRRFGRARLVALLWRLDDAWDAEGSRRPWASYIAAQFLERFVPRDDEVLALYYIPGCTFSRRVLQAIDRLGAVVELRNIWEDKRCRHELLDARGTTTVPVLRCTAHGKDRWMPESVDIIDYLEWRFGRTPAAVGGPVRAG